MGKKKDREFWESALLNKRDYIQYYNRLMELALIRFKWNNLPSTVDERYMELALFGKGSCVFFNDEVLGFLALPVIFKGQRDVYGIPINRTAFSSKNNYRKELNDTDSVIVFNNYLHGNSMVDTEIFARRLYNLDRTIDVNVNAQKTPILLTCDESQRLTLENVYLKYEGNQPVIFGNNKLDTNGIKAFTTGAPYVADRLYELKTDIWNEALTYLGISNISNTKKERMVVDEVDKNQGGTVASRYSGLEARRQACNKINEMFGLNVSVEYRQIAEESLILEKEKEGGNNE